MFNACRGLVVWVLCFVASSAALGLSGSGTSGDPYVIGNRTDFDEFCATSAYWGVGVCTRLDADIDLTGTTYAQSPIAPDTTTASGFQGVPYEGQFYGNGHRIIGMKIQSSDKSYVGLFGHIDSGLVEKLGVVNCYIIQTGSSTRYSGGLCGDLFLGTISACYSTGYISGADEIGGLCGYCSGDIVNSYSLATVKGGNVGGLIGSIGSAGSLINCYAAGLVPLHNTTTGGLMGNLYNNPTVSNCFWDVETTTQTFSYMGTGLTNDQMRTPSSFTDAGWDFVGETVNGTLDIWTMSHASGSTNGYPMLWWQTDDPDPSLTGSGVSTNPFIIADRADWDAFCANAYYWDDHIRLDVNLDLAGTTYAMAPVAPDTVTGTNPDVENFEGTPFSGHFDGNGRSISHLTIVSGTNCHLGLFGCIQYGEVFDLTVSDCSVTGNLRNIGGLCGAKRTDSNIINCHVTGTISGGTTSLSRNTGAVMGYADSAGQTTNCTADAVVSGYRNVGVFVGEYYINGLGDLSYNSSSGSASGTNSVGGFCGANNSNITNCSSDASASGQISVGGFCGFTAGGGPFDLTVFGCYATGNVTGTVSHIGGFAGTNEGILKDCYTTSSVTAYSRATGHIGGFVGWNWNGINIRCYSAGSLSADPGLTTVAGFCGVGAFSSFENCFWNTEISGILVAYTELDVPYPSQTGICVGLTTAQMQQQATFTDAGWDFVVETVNGIEDTWAMPSDASNNGFPILAWARGLSGSGTLADPYLITSLADFLYYSSKPVLWNAYVRLNCNLDLTDVYYSMAPIAPDTDDVAAGFQGVEFTGNFNGNNHRIVGLSINGETRDYIGLFGCIGTRGVVRNLDVRNGTLSGYDYLGGLCGDNNGTLEKCSATGGISGGSYSGGLAGRNAGTVTQCSAQCTIYGADYTGGLVGLNATNAGIDNCYALGVCHTTDVNTGGLVGYNDGTIIICYANCVIDANEGPYGAFCGLKTANGAIGGCYYDTAYGTDSYAFGRTAAQFVVRSTFVGWDFTGSKADGSFDYWHMPFWTNQSRPILNWQIDLLDIIDNWLQNDSLCDLNDDATVNLLDLSLHIKETGQNN